MNFQGKKTGTKTFESDSTAELAEFYEKYSYKPAKKKRDNMGSQDSQ